MSILTKMWLRATIKIRFYKNKKAKKNTLTIQKLTVKFDGKSVTTRPANTKILAHTYKPRTFFAVTVTLPMLRQIKVGVLSAREI